MSESIKGVVVVLGILIGLPLAILLIRDRLTRPSRKQMAEASREFLGRLAKPDLKSLEQHFGCSLPQSLIALYGNQTELMRHDFAVAPNAQIPEDERYYISDYQPADAKSATDVWPGWELYFAFADDGCGNGYLIDPREKDPRVYLHDHETGKLNKLCDSLSEFMQWPRFGIES